MRKYHEFQSSSSSSRPLSTTIWQSLYTTKLTVVHRSWIVPVRVRDISDLRLSRNYFLNLIADLLTALADYLSTTYMDDKISRILVCDRNNYYSRFQYIHVRQRDNNTPTIVATGTSSRPTVQPTAVRTVTTEQGVSYGRYFSQEVPTLSTSTVSASQQSPRQQPLSYVLVSVFYTTSCSHPVDPPFPSL